MAQKKNKKGMGAGEITAIGAGVAALGAGAYYMLGPDGKAHQKKAGKWMKDMENKLETKVKPAIKSAKKEMNSAMKTVKKFTGEAKKDIRAAKKVVAKAKKVVAKKKK